MVNFQLGKIYKIVCNETGLTYYGSTCDSTLARRLVAHRTEYNKENSTKELPWFKVLKGNNYEIVLVEDFPCSRREELNKQLRTHIENNECVNKIIPTRTLQEYKRDNADKKYEYYQSKEFKERKAQYQKENQDVINARSRKYRAVKKALLPPKPKKSITISNLFS